MAGKDIVLADLGADHLDDLETDLKHEYFPDSYLIPQLGVRKWDGHIFVSGATGAGKSYLINKMLANDMKDRRIYLFSNVPDDDSYNVPMLKYEEGDKLKDSICVFDDYPDISLRDHLLECGRHSNTVVLCVNHKLRDWQNTRKPLNESKYLITFPSANSSSVFQELLTKGIGRKVAKKIIELAIHDGRHLIMHQHHPATYITQRSIISNLDTLHE